MLNVIGNTARTGLGVIELGAGLPMTYLAGAPALEVAINSNSYQDAKSLAFALGTVAVGSAFISLGGLYQSGRGLSGIIRNTFNLSERRSR